MSVTHKDNELDPMTNICKCGQDLDEVLAFKLRKSKKSYNFIISHLLDGMQQPDIEECNIKCLCGKVYKSMFTLNIEADHYFIRSK